MRAKGLPPPPTSPLRPCLGPLRHRMKAYGVTMRMIVMQSLSMISTCSSVTSAHWCMLTNNEDGGGMEHNMEGVRAHGD